ncbi:SDR family oxidoreductase [Longispora sp. K20-0274]|uniref:SDR family oxidoreductase n=1 Tax=Longispora sp. K20-0274 TaxID=3088255 RepID=UPI00399B50D9
MRILVIGGTAFAGRHIVAEALSRGHDVTLFHRGRTGADLFPEATHLLGDRNEPADLAALAGPEPWDATIDVCAYRPRQVALLADALGDRGGQHVFISTMSVYRSPAAPGLTEDAPLVELADPTVEEVTAATYGGLKVLCERLVLDRYGPGSALVRPTYIVGPHDRSGRLDHWVHRIARGGEILAPGPADGPFQLVDARDLAAFTVALAENRTAGVYHTAGPRSAYTFGDLLSDILATVGPPGTRLTWVDREFLLAAGEDDSSLPMWPGGDPESSINASDPSAALAAGLAPRPVRETIADVRAHGGDAPRATPDAMTAEREAELLAAWAAR